MAVFDVAVIGAGIAGASVASELARDARVALLEAEDRPGRHATGRSAALFSCSYGPPVVRALSRASEPFLSAPPEGFAAAPLLAARGLLYVARADQAAALAALAAELGDAVSPVSADEAGLRCPLLRPGYVAAALLETSARDIDVDALHGGFLRAFRARGGTLMTDAGVTALTRDGAGWRVETPAGALRCATVVNAAGAWADAVGALAGARPTGLTPKRRTAIILDAPPGMDLGAAPLVVDAEERFYLKPDAGRLLASPADETPSPPCDAQPEEIDVAECVDRIERAFALSVRRIPHRWAGLRSFVADKSPVAGWDAAAPGFFWLAGQGGYGVQTAPALARAAAALVRGAPLPPDIAAEGVTADALSPARLRVPCHEQSR